jgi:hypothetical protein
VSSKEGFDAIKKMVGKWFLAVLLGVSLLAGFMYCGKAKATAYFPALTHKTPEPWGDIILGVHDYGEVVRMKPNGDFIIKGRRVKNDMHVYLAFKHFACKEHSIQKDKAALKSCSELEEYLVKRDGK